MSARKAVEDVVAIHLEALRIQREADAALVEGVAESFEAARRADYRFCSYEAIVQLVALAAKIRGQA